MFEVSRSKKPLGIYPMMLWMAINVIMLTYMTLSHPDQPNSLAELVLWIPSMAGLWLMKKWGAALSAAVLGITVGISLGNLLLAYYSSASQLPFVPVNALRIILNVVAFVYLFTCIFANKFG